MYIWGTGISFILLHLHFIFFAILTFAFFASLIWFTQYLDKEKSRNIIVWTLIIWVVGTIITSIVWMQWWGHIMNMYGNNMQNRIMWESDCSAYTNDYLNDNMMKNDNKR
jgi:heme/copper-type cytochrome/quinol oxidase subunit 1